MKKKTILHIIDSLKRGGAETLLTGYIPVLEDFNHIIVTLIPLNDFSAELEGFPVLCLDHNNHFCLLNSCIKLKKIIAKYDVSIVHSHLYWSTIIARMSTPKKVKFYFSVHNIMSSDAYKKNYSYLILEKLTYRKHHNIIGVSNEVLLDYDKHVRIKSRKYLLYNFIADAFFRNSIATIKPESGSIKMVSVGNLKEQKNYFYLINFFKRFKNTSVSLDIYGEGPLKEILQKEIIKHNLPINLRGSQKDICNVLPRYQIFISPSYYEGFGIAPLEAMASGLVTILSDIPVYREVAGDAAIFIDIKDVSDLNQKISKILSNNIDIVNLIAKGKTRAEEIGGKVHYVKLLSRIYSGG